MKLMVLGKLKIGGDMSKALKLEPIFKLAGEALQVTSSPRETPSVPSQVSPIRRSLIPTANNVD